MTLYHGSDRAVETPELRPLTRPLDFGRGFYATTIEGQARDWARKKAVRGSGVAVVSQYEADLTGLRVKTFNGACEEWADFIIACRSSKPDAAVLAMAENYDAIMGEVADDDVFDSIDAYMNGFMSKDKFLEQIKAKRRNDQICFRTVAAFERIQFVRWFHA